MDDCVIEGARLEVRVIAAASAAATTLVFLHEGLGSVSLWRDFPDRVARATGLGAVVYSRRGYGRSEPAPLPRGVDFMHREAWDVLPALLRACAIERPLLVGHSDGASIALLYAARHPVARVAAMAPHVFVEDVCVTSIAGAARAYAAGELRARLARHHADVDNAFHGWADVWLSPEFRAWNIEDEVARVAAPLLVIQGRDDEYGTLAQVAAIAARARGPVDALALARCGHSPHRDRPEAVLAAIAAFVREGSP
jgi:pimeloyl-ACP methyl ester carboxylesterase